MIQTLPTRLELPLAFVVCFDASDFDEATDFSEGVSSSIASPTGFVVCLKSITKATSRRKASRGVSWKKLIS